MSSATPARDLTISKFLTTNPLRSKNLRRLTYREDGAGHLRKRPNGEWWVEIPKAEFKNEHGAAGDRDYVVMVNEGLWGYIETYLEVYRPVLLKGKKSDLVFPVDQNRNGAKNLEISHKILGEALTHFTVRFCPVPTPGFGPHAYRHIIPTDFLKNNPNGIQVAADILHDKPQTVAENYAHLTRYDGFKHWDRYYNETASRIEKEGDDA